MDKSTRFLFIAVPALMAIVLLIAVVAISNRSPTLRTSTHVETGTASTADRTGADKILFAPGEGTLAGVILTPDGQPNSVPVKLRYRSQRWETESRRSGISGSLATGVTDTFSHELSAGITTLIAEGDGYAISSIGPFENYAGQTIENIEFRLDSGRPLTVTVQDPNGNPITDATLSGSSQIERSYWGSQKAEQRDPGTYVFPHVAAVPYRIRGNAAGFEPTVLEIEAPHDGPVTFVIKPALPTTGIVLDSTGQPVANARLILLYRHPNHYFSGGKEIGQADNRGQFRLLDLSREHQYFGFVEAPDGRRGTFENLKSDQTELTLHIQSPPRLTGTVQGELKVLSWRDGKRYVDINQRIPVALPDGNESFPLNSYAPVATQDGQHTFAFNGLLTDDWELVAGDVTYQHDGREGDVHLDINLETGEVTVNHESTKVDQ